MTANEAAADIHHVHSRLPLPWSTFVGFVLQILATLLIGIATYTTLQSRTESRELVAHTVEVSSALRNLQALLIDAETSQRGYLLTGDETYLEPFSASASNVTAGHRRLQQLVSDNPRQLERLATLQELIDAKFAELNRTIELRRAGNVQDAIAAVRTDRGRTTMDQIREYVATMVQDENTLLQQREADWQQASQFSVFVTVGGAMLLLVLIAVFATTSSRDYRQREMEGWLRILSMQFATRLQGENRLGVLGESALSFLAHSLGAQVGAIYIAGSDGNFRRVAGYALAPEAAESLLRPGDSLPGQAARDRRTLQVSDLPANYLPVSSALGQTAPRELLIAPAMTEEDVQAVIELGFLQRTTRAHRELLERTSESLARAVRASRDRTRLEDLLEETQRQAEELQTQQEELRVSNEELEVQTRALKESQAHLEMQQLQLAQNNTQLEEYTQMLEQQRDDLTRAQTVLSEKAGELERANQYKSEFLANMSHELRTPLNSSLILAKLLADNQDGNLTAEQVRFASNIYSAGNDLLELINDILDLSKIEARQIDVKRETIGMQSLLDNMRQTFSPLAEQKSVAFEIDVAADVPVALSTDSQRLRQILKNLLSNALKFTMQGHVRLSVFVPEGADRADWIGFAVEDTGIGIAAEQHGIIFEPFRQADGTTNRRFGGTGLGLSISRELAALLGGRIELQSVPGAGSTFTLLIPQTMPLQERATPASPPAALSPGTAHSTPARRAAKSAAPADVPPAAATSGRILLIIEDDPAFAATIATLASSFQFDCLIASSADEGIDMAFRHRPTAIVLDIRLPDHTGLSVLDRLKHNPATRHIPVQVISGFDYSQTALEMGAANVLKKPVDREQLITALAALESKAAQEQRNVLIVEDNRLQRDSIERLLQSELVRTVAVPTAAEALGQLQKMTFDCMVLDLSLPDASGLELLQKMAEDDSYAFPPVIVYTGRSLSADEEQQLRRYSKSIIIKGARSPERLLDEVTLFLHRVEASLPAEQQRMLRVARSRESVFDKRRILLAEDDVRNVFAISRVLEPHGALLEIARNGNEALATLERRKDIDLVLMDIMMPEMDGLEAMRRIRSHPALRNLPIIALTAKAMPDDRQRCLDAGANDYITKPIDIEKLLSLLRIWMPPPGAPR
ncbi:MAG TPA: response regulator [Povalibacter sp.]|uniref:response regulator n=1 Tax=Povalibacter sp. TaxID=1962978 RepID=UPI002BCDD5F0|nr:response regulator [Povalibacter sp.]HMN46520.1 response regulator [Povalibacter sp.]